MERIKPGPGEISPLLLPYLELNVVELARLPDDQLKDLRALAGAAGFPLDKLDEALTLARTG